MIRLLLHAIGAAVCGTAPARPYSLRDRCADASARAAAPAEAIHAHLIRTERIADALRAELARLEE